MTWILGILTSIGKGLAGVGHWFWFTATPKMKAVILGLLFALGVLGYILYLQHKNHRLEIDVQEGNLNRQMVNVDILTNQIDESKERSNALSQNTNQADRDRNTIDRRDSNSFSGADNDRAFCSRYPNDSSCAEYCAHHPDVCGR